MTNYSILLLFLLSITHLSVDIGISQGAQKLIIGTKEAAPFSMKDPDGRWQGVSVELWQRIAKNNNLEYEFREYDLAGLLNALENGSIDAGVAALTITAEREEKIDFAHAYYNSGLGIATRPAKRGNWVEVFDRFLSLAFLKIVATLALLLLVVGFVVWLFERRKNAEQFGGTAIHGIGSGFWWSAVTMTTVGYGDKAPQTLGGRLVGLIWMFTAIIVISGFTAAITSTLTVSQIHSMVKGVDDLRHLKVGSVGLSTSAAYLNNQHIPFINFTNTAKAMQALAEGSIDAVVYDAPILRYLTSQKFDNKVIVLPILFEKQHYGIGLPTGSKLRELINREIPSIIINDDWKDLLYKYLGSVRTQ